MSWKELLLELQDHQIHHVLWRIEKERSPGRVFARPNAVVARGDSHERIPKNGRANILRLSQEDQRNFGHYVGGGETGRTAEPR